MTDEKAGQVQQAHFNSIIILTRALITISNGQDKSAHDLQLLARKALDDWDKARTVPPGDDGLGCPNCGGTWPTACSCPAGTVYLMRHEPPPYRANVLRYGGATEPDFRIGDDLPLSPHRHVKLESGHVVCYDCLLRGQYVDGATVFTVKS